MSVAVPLRVRYAVSFAGLVTIALISSSLLQLSIAYQENQVALAQIQKERAAAASTSIQHFATDVGRELTRASVFARSPGLEGIEERRVAYLRLVRETPSIAGVTYVDRGGRELLSVSQLELSSTELGADRSQDLVFTEASQSRPYFGPLYSREGAEPYASVSVKERFPEAGVMIAEVKLKSVWDEVSRIRLGQAGLAYIVDSDGVLVAHPTVGLVLARTNMSSLPHVQQALGQVPGQEATAYGIVTWDMNGRQVLATYDFVDPPGWFVVLEQPLDEAWAPLNSLILRTAGLLALGLLVSLAASWVLARRMVTPIHELRTGAARIGTGDLTERIHVRTGDELQDLAGSFNAMADELENQMGTLRESRARVVAAQESVRRDIASHLHGRVQGQLLALRGRLEEALDVRTDDPAYVQAISEVVEGLNRVAQEEISGLSRRLYPAILRRGLTPALLSLGDQFRPALPVEVEIGERLSGLERAETGNLREDVRLAAYRIAEEAVGNALKHADARRALLTAEVDAMGRLRISISDDGRGFVPDGARNGLGLTAMQDYAAAVGGLCEFHSVPGRTEVVVLFPLPGPIAAGGGQKRSGATW